MLSVEIIMQMKVIRRPSQRQDKGVGVGRKMKRCGACKKPHLEGEPCGFCAGAKIKGGFRPGILRRGGYNM